MRQPHTSPRQTEKPNTTNHMHPGRRRRFYLAVLANALGFPASRMFHEPTPSYPPSHQPAVPTARLYSELALKCSIADVHLSI